MQDAAAFVAMITSVGIVALYVWYAWHFLGLRETVQAWWYHRQEVLDDLDKCRRMWEIS